MRMHYLKIRKDFADAVAAGDKNFEIRYNDRGYQKGDHVLFAVWEEKGEAAVYVAHEIDGKEYEITYVMNGWGLKNDYVVFGIKEVHEMEDVTSKYAGAIEKFANDFSLAADDTSSRRLEDIQEKISKEDADILTDIGLLNELEYGLRHNIKIMQEVSK